MASWISGDVKYRVFYLMYPRVFEGAHRVSARVLDEFSAQLVCLVKLKSRTYLLAEERLLLICCTETTRRRSGDEYL